MRSQSNFPPIQLKVLTLHFHPGPSEGKCFLPCTLGACGFKTPVSYQMGFSLFPSHTGFRATVSAYKSCALYTDIHRGGLWGLKTACTGGLCSPARPRHPTLRKDVACA